MSDENDDGMRFQLPTDRLILQHLTEGRNVGANIANDIGKHRKTVNPRLRQLEDYGLVRNIGNGVYELTDEGRSALGTFEKYGDRRKGDLGDLVEERLSERENNA